MLPLKSMFLKFRLNVQIWKNNLKSDQKIDFWGIFSPWFSKIKKKNENLKRWKTKNTVLRNNSHSTFLQNFEINGWKTKKKKEIEIGTFFIENPRWPPITWAKRLFFRFCFKNPIRLMKSNLHTKFQLPSPKTEENRFSSIPPP